MICSASILEQDELACSSSSQNSICLIHSSCSSIFVGFWGVVLSDSSLLDQLGEWLLSHRTVRWHCQSTLPWERTFHSQSIPDDLRAPSPQKQRYFSSLQHTKTTAQNRRKLHSLTYTAMLIYRIQLKVLGWESNPSQSQPFIRHYILTTTLTNWIRGAQVAGGPIVKFWTLHRFRVKCHISHIFEQPIGINHLATHHLILIVQHSILSKLNMVVYNLTETLAVSIQK